MVIVVSLIAALLFGSGDFCGALAARRASAIQVVAVSHLVGLVGVTVASLVMAQRFSPGDMVLGAVGGAFGAIGVWLLYRRLAIGPMYVVAPLTAVSAAVIPTLWGTASGERLAGPAWTGMALALVAVALVSYSPASAGGPPVTARVIMESLAAGLAFGAFYILLGATSQQSAPWPIVGARLTTTVLLVAILAATGRPLAPRHPSTVVLMVVTGLCEVAANVGFLWAATRGHLAVASVLTSLYPIATVVLAQLVLKERMNRLQHLGVIGALTATVLITAG